MTSETSGLGEGLDGLNALHQEIGMEFAAALEADGADWAKARLMVQYRPNEDYQWSLRFLDGNDKLGGVLVTERIEELTKQFRTAFDEVTGEALKRFRLNLDSSGSFTVEYSYDEPVGSPKWDWPDEETATGS